jgi:hypothetical protein
MTAAKSPADEPTRLTAGSKRPPSHADLHGLVYRLYAYRCLCCYATRPLAVAHIDSWPLVRDALLRAQPGTETYRGPTEDEACWHFHHPANVVLLCCNCHALLDDAKVIDITKEHVRELQDRARWNINFLVELRAFVCRAFRPTLRREYDLLRLDLNDWLHQAAVARVLPPPHQFTVPIGPGGWVQVDLTENIFEIHHEPIANLPRWTGSGFAV